MKYVTKVKWMKNVQIISKNKIINLVVKLPESDVTELFYVRAIKFNNDTIEITFTIANSYVLHQYEYKTLLNGSHTTGLLTAVTIDLELESHTRKVTFNYYACNNEIKYYL